MSLLSFCLFVLFLFVCLFCFLWPHPRHVEVPRVRVKWELQLPATATATATPDLSGIRDLHHNSQQHWILTPPSEARTKPPSSWMGIHLISVITSCFVAGEKGEPVRSVLRRKFLVLGIFCWASALWEDIYFDLVVHIFWGRDILINVN